MREREKEMNVLDEQGSLPLQRLEEAVAEHQDREVIERLYQAALDYGHSVPMLRAAILGALWTEEAVEEALSGAYATTEGEYEYVILSADVSPAVALEAARRRLGTQDVEFSHLAMGTYPVYKSAKVK